MPIHHRRAFRHAVDLRCRIVRERDFRFIAERAVDLSTDGMQATTEVEVLTGEPLIVSFRAPRGAQWIDTAAVVARVIHGRRPGEHERRLGIAFDGLDLDARHALFQALRTLPPASPRAHTERPRR